VQIGDQRDAESLQLRLEIIDRNRHALDAQWDERVPDACHTDDDRRPQKNA